MLFEIEDAGIENGLVYFDLNYDEEFRALVGKALGKRRASEADIQYLLYKVLKAISAKEINLNEFIDQLS